MNLVFFIGFMFVSFWIAASVSRLMFSHNYKKRGGHFKLLLSNCNMHSNSCCLNLCQQIRSEFCENTFYFKILRYNILQNPKQTSHFWLQSPLSVLQTFWLVEDRLDAAWSSKNDDKASHMIFIFCHQQSHKNHGLAYTL